MSRVQRTPKYRLHKSTRQGVVTIHGKDHYLGAFGSPESQERYDRLVAGWLQNGRRLPQPECRPISINEIALGFCEHEEARFKHRRSNAKHSSKVRRALRLMKQLFGHTPAASFGPKSLLLFRQRLIDDGQVRRTPDSPARPMSRKTIKDHVAVVRKMFRWATVAELVPAEVWKSLDAVEGLRAGESAATEPKRILPVPDAHVDAILDHVLPPVRTLIELQRCTGMRPGEAVQMRGCDLNMDGELWEYRPAHHKTEHRGHERVIMLGQRAKAAIQPYLRANLQEHLFRPDEAERERDIRRRTERKSKLWESHQRRYERDRKMAPKRTPRSCYSVCTYARAIRRACEKAGIPRWTPHRLRHSYATYVRREYGIEAARVMLGHQHVGVTEVYAERDTAVAATIAGKVG